MIYQDTTAIDAVNNTPDAFYDPKHPSQLIATSKWVNTDGWRGYTDIVPEAGYKEIAEDWVTGNWSDAPEGNSESEVDAKIKQLESEYGNVYVIFVPTSNVFSTSYSVLVRDKDTTSSSNKGVVVGHKTRKFTEPDGSWRVRYHATDVIAYNASTGKYTLNTGGWATTTTSKRINQYLPCGYYAYRKNWVMYVHTPSGSVELTDGMEI